MLATLTTIREGRRPLPPERLRDRLQVVQWLQAELAAIERLLAVEHDRVRRSPGAMTQAGGTPEPAPLPVPAGTPGAGGGPVAAAAAPATDAAPVGGDDPLAGADPGRAGASVVGATSAAAAR